jgi:hypothetical protein
MTLRAFAIVLPLLAACAASPAPSAVDPSVARRARLCAEEHPLDAMARVGCESDRGRLAAVSRPLPQHRPRGNAAVTAPVVLVAPSGPPAGQGLADYGRQLAAPPVRCMTIGMGAFATTTCR